MAACRALSGDGESLPAGSDSLLRSSALDLLPGRVPGVVVLAVVLTVAANSNRRLPELDAVEVRRRRTAVVLRRGALCQLVHDRARLRVRGRLAEVDGLLGLRLRLRDVLHPLVRAVR